MPKVVGLKERRHAPYWDTILREDTNAFAGTAIVAQTRLFNGTNLGQQQWTNMPAASQFPSDNTYIVLAMRLWLYFEGTNALLMYTRTQMELYLTLNIGDKPQFSAPGWFFPAGGGISGWDSATPIATNGVPSQEAILKLAKPIPIPARQHFTVVADFHDLGSSSVRTQYLNAATTIGRREVKVVLDGLHTRDVL